MVHGPIRLGLCLAAFAPAGLDGALRAAGQAGVDVVDLPADSTFSLVDPDRLDDPAHHAELRARLDAAHIKVGCVSNSRDTQLVLGPHGPHTDPVLAGTAEEKREYGLRAALGTIRLAAGVGTPQARLMLGVPDLGRWLSWWGSDVSWSDNVAAWCEAAKPALELAAELGVRVVFEPHPKQVAYDPVNVVRGWGSDLAAVHAKDLQHWREPQDPRGAGWSRYGPGPAIRFRALGSGALPWPEIVAALLDEDYRGVIYVEHEDALFPTEQGVANSLALLRRLLPSASAQGEDLVSLDGVRGGLLAGGLGERMGPLTAKVCKPLVPYLAACRLVDFSMANAVRSGMPEVVLLSLHRESDLVEHLLTHWDDEPGTKVHFGPHDELLRSGEFSFGDPLPERPEERGTADALLSNAEYLFAPGASDVLVQQADHVYLFDYAEMVAAHRASGADCTIGVQRIERKYVKLFGMVDVDDDLRVRALVEKPQNPTSDLIFTAFCLFRVDALQEVLADLVARGEDVWQHDISRDVLPEMIRQGRPVSAFPIEGYWADIGTVDRYHSEQLKMQEMAPSALPRTLSPSAPTYLSSVDTLSGVEVPPGAVVESSVLHPGCVIEPGAKVLRSVVLPGAVVPSGVTVRDSIVLANEHLLADREGLGSLPPF